jgi:hypothetical protein
MWDVWRRKEIRTKFLWDKDEKRGRIEHLVANRRAVLKQRLNK